MTVSAANTPTFRTPSSAAASLPLPVSARCQIVLGSGTGSELSSAMPWARASVRN